MLQIDLYSNREKKGWKSFCRSGFADLYFCNGGECRLVFVTKHFLNTSEWSESWWFYQVTLAADRRILSDSFLMLYMFYVTPLNWTCDFLWSNQCGVHVCSHVDQQLSPDKHASVTHPQRWWRFWSCFACPSRAWTCPTCRRNLNRQTWTFPWWSNRKLPPNSKTDWKYGWPRKPRSESLVFKCFCCGFLVDHAAWHNHHENRPSAQGVCAREPRLPEPRAASSPSHSRCWRAEELGCYWRLPEPRAGSSPSHSRCWSAEGIGCYCFRFVPDSRFMFCFWPWGLTACQNHPGWTGNCTWPFSVWLVSVFLIQAVVAVFRLPAGEKFVMSAFPVACATSMIPTLSDYFDTLKDVIFSALCLNSDWYFIKFMGICSWIYLVAIHVYFVFYRQNCLAELCGTYVPLIAVPPAPKGTKGSGDGIWSGTLLPLLYKQLTPTKRELLLWENVPQAGFSIIFLLVEGGSLFISFVNLALPAFQVILAFTLFRWVRSAVGPHLGKQLNGAMAANDFLKTRHIWEEAGRHWGWGGNGDSGLGLCHHQLHQF